MCRSISAKSNIDTDLTPQRVHVTTAQGDMARAIKQPQLGTTQATVWQSSMTEYTQTTWASNKCLNLDRYATWGATQLRACLPSSAYMAEAERPNHEQQYGHTQEHQKKGPPKHSLHNNWKLVIKQFGAPEEIGAPAD